MGKYRELGSVVFTKIMYKFQREVWYNIKLFLYLIQLEDIDTNEISIVQDYCFEELGTTPQTLNMNSELIVKMTYIMYQQV